MKAYWDEQNHKLVFDLEGHEIKGNFTIPINESDIMILNGVFFNTTATAKKPCSSCFDFSKDQSASFCGGCGRAFD